MHHTGWKILAQTIIGKELSYSIIKNGRVVAAADLPDLLDDSDEEVTPLALQPAAEGATTVAAAEIPDLLEDTDEEEVTPVTSQPALPGWRMAVQPMAKEAGSNPQDTRMIILNYYIMIFAIKQTMHLSL